MVYGSTGISYIGSQAPGGITVGTGQFAVHGKRLELVSTQRVTLEGTSRLILCG
jgi:hypothetical protein